MSFQSALSGLNAAAKNLDIIGNNVANSTTVGFKGSGAQFADMYANAAGGSGGVTIGIGTTLAKVQQQFTQGNITTTGNPLDMAINGGGLFRMDHLGLINYSRDGQFSIDKNGYVVNAAGDKLTGYLVNSNGTLNQSAPSPILISSADIAPQVTGALGASGGVQAKLNLDSRMSNLATASFNIGNSATYSSATSVSVFDSLGNQHALSMYFIKTAANAWDMITAMDGTVIGAPTVTALTFDGAGALTTTMPIASGVAVTLTNGANNLDFYLDFTGTTQYGSPFAANSLNQDGYAPGRLAGYNVGSDGTILGRYSNGQSKTLGQVVLANFANPNGLNSLGGNAWAESIDSGSPLVGIAGTGKNGAIQAGAVEDANVDVTNELVKMITAQRIYQSNAQSIKTQDSVLQTLVNLR